MALYTPPIESVRRVWERIGGKSVDTEEDLIQIAREIFESKLDDDKLKVGFKVIPARAQQELFRHMLLFTQRLRQGRLRGSGLSGKMIVGPKGIGKSTAAKTFVSLIEAIYSDTIGVYITMQGTKAGQRSFSDKSLFDTLRDFLKAERNLEIDIVDRFTSAEEGFMRFLKREKKYLVIFVDELDEFYANEPQIIFVRTLQELQLLGSSDEGRIATILCGSSAYLTDLIQGNRTPIMKERYPLLNTGVPDLNGSKFRTERVYSNLPVDLETVALILEDLQEQHSQTVQDKNSFDMQTRALAFIAGSTIRTVQLEFLATSSVSERSAFSESFTVYRLSKASKVLFQFVMEKLVEKNRSLLEQFRDKESFLERISTIPWEKRYEPLTWNEVEEIWNHVISSYRDEKDLNLLAHILHLSDTSWIVLDGGAAGAPKLIYPKTVYLSLETLMGERLDPATKSKIIQFVSGTLSNEHN
jgi:hypothetical protein